MWWGFVFGLLKEDERLILMVLNMEIGDIAIFY